MNIAPENSAETWDNVGLIIGETEQTVCRVLVAVDLSFEVIKEAKKKNIDLIVTHHPILFRKVQKVNNQTIDGRKIIELINNKIALYSLHTNFDACDIGTAVTMGQLLELEDLKPVADELADKYIRVGTLKANLKYPSLVTLVKQKFNIDSIRTIGYTNTASTVAVCPGACYDMISGLSSTIADVFITGELKYHEAIDLYDKGFSVLEIGHFESELPAMQSLVTALQKQSNELKYNLCIYLSEEDFSPIEYR